MEKYIEYLTHIITTDGIQVNPQKIEAIINWGIPTSIPERQSFFGFCTYYRRFLEDFLKACSPFTDTNKHMKFLYEAQTKLISLNKRKMFLVTQQF